MAHSIEDNVIAAAQSKVAKAEMCWGQNHPKLVKELQNLSDLYLVLEKYEEAKPIYWRILDIQYRLYGSTHVNNAETLLSLGELHEAQNCLSIAEQFYVGALWIIDQTGIEPVSDLAGRILLKLYGLYKLSGKNEKIPSLEMRLYTFLKREHGKIDSVPRLPQAAIASPLAVA